MNFDALTAGTRGSPPALGRSGRAHSCFQSASNAAYVERALAGVRVRLQLDAAGAVGSLALPFLFAACNAAVQLKWFRRWNWRRPRRYNRRSHRKLLVIDHRIAYVGGFNVHRLSSRRSFGETRWRDSHAGITGPLVHIAAMSFDAFWRGHLHWSPAATANASESLEITAERWAGRRWPGRVLEVIGWTLRRWL